MASQKKCLPFIEHGSFYTPYKSKNPCFSEETDSYMDEYPTTYIDYRYDNDGHCKMVTCPYGSPLN